MSYFLKVIEPENAKDLCRGIVQLIRDETLRHAMKKRCREIAVNEYSVDLETSKYIELYQRLLQDQ